MRTVTPMEFQSRLDLFEPGDLTALVCVDEAYIEYVEDGSFAEPNEVGEVEGGDMPPAQDHR